MGRIQKGRSPSASAGDKNSAAEALALIESATEPFLLQQSHENNGADLPPKTVKHVFLAQSQEQQAQ